ncbi:MAG: DUF1566 domain-containing protein [Desulfobulbus sp.]|jgi:hypothetical protein|uniref:Lcl C-terminal domain-containing protein n=1 Tax=Desulfobulbus sp. TaxID=895 RepID=UPI002842E3B2|nr:DUF1566 domain-containing protein [Desulfobulbus sp.]MDR2551379.1 DUF1566 domain-containing protein [Desulfobulbus sp.]
MGLFKKLVQPEIAAIDWEMTPEYTFGTFESWGGRERVRSKNERIYYFFIDAWDEEPKLCLMERGIKHARVIAEILAPPEMVRRCVDEQGKVARFERTHPINEELKQWLLANVVESEDDSKVIPLVETSRAPVAGTDLPGRDAAPAVPERIVLPHEPVEMSEENVTALVLRFNFVEQERNPQGSFVKVLVDNDDGLTVSDRATGLMWQRGGTDIMSHRSMRREIERINGAGFAGFSDWRLPSMAEALSLLEREQSAAGQYLHGCFSGEQPFVFVDATRKPGGQWFVDFKQGRAFWSSGTIPGGFGRLCRREKD